MIVERLDNPIARFIIGNDTHLPSLPTMSFTLDRPVSQEILESAIQKALDVYPVMGMGIAVEDGKGYCVPNDRPIVITRGDMPLRPGTEQANGHGFAVSIEGTDVTFSCLHSLYDGGGILRFLKTVLYFYFCQEDGREYHPGGVRTSGDIRETLGNYFDLDYSDTQPNEAPPSSYCPPEFRLDGDFEWGRITLDSAEFLRLAKECHTSPSVLLFLLFARTIYAQHPEVSDRVGLTMTIDCRGFLNMPETSLNCSLFTYLFTERAIDTREELAHTAERLRKDLKAQLTPEQMHRTAGDVVLRGVGDAVPTACKMAYFGRFDMGEATPHVLDLRPVEASVHKMDAVDINGQLQISLMLGGATRSYLEAFAVQAEKLGLAVKPPVTIRIPKQEN